MLLQVLGGIATEIRSNIGNGRAWSRQLLWISGVSEPIAAFGPAAIVRYFTRIVGFTSDIYYRVVRISTDRKGSQD